MARSSVNQTSTTNDARSGDLKTSQAQVEDLMKESHNGVSFERALHMCVHAGGHDATDIVVVEF
jgi:hypothetical protein